MKITNQVLEELLQKDIKSILGKEFTTRTSFHLARILSKIELETKVYFAEKQKLIDKYSKKDKEGKPIVKEGNYTISEPKKFSKELEDLLSLEFELGVDKIKLDLDNEPRLTVLEMMSLLPFIE